MKIKITERVEREIDVLLPYYYKHDCGGDDYVSVYYGRVDKDRTTIINLSRRYGGGSVSAEVEVIERGGPQYSASAGYFVPEYKSTEAEFLQAKAQALEILWWA